MIIRVSPSRGSEGGWVHECRLDTTRIEFEPAFHPRTLIPSVLILKNFSLHCEEYPTVVTIFDSLVLLMTSYFL